MPGRDGLVRIALKRPFSDGTVAIDMDPLSLLCRLAALIPAPRFHTVRYSGVLGPASKWRPLIVPKPLPDARDDAASAAEPDSCSPPPGEATEPPTRAPARDPPFTHSRVRRRRHDEHSAQRGLFEEH